MDARVRAEAKATKTATASKRRKDRNAAAGGALLGLAEDERRGEGKALREEVAPEAHAEWYHQSPNGCIASRPADEGQAVPRSADEGRTIEAAAAGAQNL
jgi:hypothetical protein